MYNIEKIKTAYDYYKLLLEKKDILTKQIEEFEKNEANKGIIELYNLLKKDSREKKINFDENPLVEDLFSKHDKVFDYYELKDNLKICENNIRDLIEECAFEIGIPLNNQIIILKEKDKKYLVDLFNFYKIDISKYDDSYINFIKRLIGLNFIAEVDPFDLPLLMAIREDIEKAPDLSDIKEEEQDEEMSYIMASYSTLIENEYFRAYMNDAKETENKQHRIRNELPFIYSSDDVIKEWNKFDDKKKNFTEEEYWLEYYKLLIIFGNNIENLYLEADDDKKKYVIDAYYYYSSLKDKDNFRTASSIINTEVLKRKIMNKK